MHKFKLKQLIMILSLSISIAACSSGSSNLINSGGSIGTETAADNVFADIKELDYTPSKQQPVPLMRKTELTEASSL